VPEELPDEPVEDVPTPETVATPALDPAVEAVEAATPDAAPTPEEAPADEAIDAPTPVTTAEPEEVPALPPPADTAHSLLGGACSSDQTADVPLAMLAISDAESTRATRTKAIQSTSESNEASKFLATPR
jgi:hypothetical protein